MKTLRYHVVLLLSCFVSIQVAAVSIDEVDKGDTYYLGQIGQNAIVTVVRVDRLNNRAKVRKVDGFTEWVNPNRLHINKADNLKAEAGEAGLWVLGGIAVLCALDEECRKNAGKSSPSPDRKAAAVTDRKYSSCLSNATDGLVRFSTRWDGQTEWENQNVKPGHYWLFTSTHDRKLWVRFDYSFTSGYQRKEYWLKRKLSSTEICEDAKRYRFVTSGGNLDVVGM